MQWSCHKHIPIAIMSILEWNLHDMNEMLLLMIPVPSPHRLLSTCNMPCMKNNLQNKDICFICEQPSDIIDNNGHTPIIYFVDNPPIYNSGHTSIIYCVNNPLIYNNGHTLIIYCVDNPSIYNSGQTPIIHCVDNPPIYNLLDILR